MCRGLVAWLRACGGRQVGRRCGGTSRLLFCALFLSLSFSEREKSVWVQLENDPNIPKGEEAIESFLEGEGHDYEPQNPYQGYMTDENGRAIL